jgi:hypothetical protein
MRELVGRAIYKRDWLGGVSKADWLLIEGPYGIKQRRTPTAAGIYPSEIARCPRAKAAKLDRALGRYARVAAQYSTVDSWLEDHGLPVDPRKPAPLVTFNAIMRKAFGVKAAAVAAPRGPKAKVVPRLINAIKADITEGGLTIDQVRQLPLKELMARYNAKQTSVRDARSGFLKLRTTPKKNK